MKIVAIIALLFLAGSAAADDGELFSRNVSKTPNLETEHATVKMLKLYVPAQTSSGELQNIEYYNAEGAVADTREQAKPLIAFYHDGEVTHVPDVGFPGHGKKDVFGAVSLDDGATWKRTNLSRTGDLSSFTLKDGTAYPGDTFRLFAASAGNKVIVAWASRYARGGSPNYAMNDTERIALAKFLGLGEECTDEDTSTLCLYFDDIWGVAGSQKSSDFADEGYPTVGEVPYASLWVARGTLVETKDEQEDTTIFSEIVWRKAERLTSGVRDVHRIEAKAVAGAGFVITWQEDPEGLRPGKGEGPGEGWSGAIAHHQTDIWYSYIDWDHFDLVYNDEGEGEGEEAYPDPIELAEYNGEGIPQVGVPFSMPVRLTDNAMCSGAEDDPDDPYYCTADFDDSGTPDFCASTVTVNIVTPEGPVNDVTLCVAEDGRIMRGNVAATRARTHLQGYDSDGDGTEDSAWVSLAYEESKGLGEEEDLDPQELIEKVDMGKNIWYHTFDMFKPELVSQGMQLNQPAVYPDDWAIVGGRLKEDKSSGYRFMDIAPDPIYEDQAGLVSTLYQNEIARRFSMITQPAHLAGHSGTVAFAMFKQGIVRQGGPADVMARRFVLPAGFNPKEDNPFAYENMDCGTRQFTDGSNPRYVKGLCVEPAINMSGTSIVECESEGDGCAADFPWNEYFDDIDMSTTEDALAKVLKWEQIDPGLDTEGNGNFDDLTWDNPYEVAKGHRGFIFGDFIMMIYAWSPNWMANTVGHDTYNLYARRSFDGGQTWTTLPADFDMETPEVVTVTADGTTTCEIYRAEEQGDQDPVECTTYPAGAFEPARNLSQLVGTKLTVLDPRFSGTKATPSTPSILTDGDFLYPDDEHDPSKFFITFEVGDNSTVAEGEATPLDMYYSRAFNFGDDYEVVAIDEPKLPDLPPYYFDWLENKKKYHAAEAAVLANPGGTFFYAIWNQWQEDAHENVFDSDAILRRIMFLDENEFTDPSGGGGGNSKK